MAQRYVKPWGWGRSGGCGIAMYTLDDKLNVKISDGSHVWEAEYGTEVCQAPGLGGGVNGWG